MKSYGPEVAILRELPDGKLSSLYEWQLGREYEVVKRDKSLVELKISDGKFGPATATLNPSRVEILPVVELRAKRIVTVEIPDGEVEIVCFEYEHDQLEKYEHLVGEEVKIRLVDSNGEFVSNRNYKQTLLNIRAPNRGNTIGGADDVLFARVSC